jgi:hypothetical protein
LTAKSRKPFSISHLSYHISFTISYMSSQPRAIWQCKTADEKWWIQLEVQL